MTGFRIFLRNSVGDITPYSPDNSLVWGMDLTGSAKLLDCILLPDLNRLCSPFPPMAEINEENTTCPKSAQPSGIFLNMMVAIEANS
ncbi:unnamed protein product, partial [Allacma fusca]